MAWARSISSGAGGAAKVASCAGSKSATPPVVAIQMRPRESRSCLQLAVALGSPSSTPKRSLANSSAPGSERAAASAAPRRAGCRGRCARSRSSPIESTVPAGPDGVKRHRQPGPGRGRRVEIASRYSRARARPTARGGLRDAHLGEGHRVVVRQARAAVPGARRLGHPPPRRVLRAACRPRASASPRVSVSSSETTWSEGRPSRVVSTLQRPCSMRASPLRSVPTHRTALPSGAVDASSQRPWSASNAGRASTRTQRSPTRRTRPSPTIDAQSSRGRPRSRSSARASTCGPGRPWAAPSTLKREPRMTASPSAVPTQ